MPMVRFQIKFSEAERDLLRKRAKKENLTEADVLRISMVMDAMMCGDADAWRILGENLRAKAVNRLGPLMGLKVRAAL